MSKEIERQIVDKIKEIKDIETNRKLGELNTVTDVRIVDDGIARIVFTPSSPYSPIAVDIGRDLRRAASEIPGVKKVIVLCQGHMQDELVNRLVNRD